MSQGTSSSSHTDDGIHAMADGNIPESLQDKEPGYRQILYQAMTMIRLILALGEPKAKLTLANITKA